MAAYIKAVDFSVKDDLITGDPDKRIKGVEIDDEFDAIAIAVNTKADLFSPAFLGVPTAATASPGVNNTQIATTAFVTAAINATKNALYPVGSIYTNATNNTNPATLLGFGTWTAFGAGRVMVGFNGSDPLFDTAEKTGGSKDSTVVEHSHTVSGTAATQSITGSYDTVMRLPGGSGSASGALSITEGSNVTSWASSGSGSRKIINLNATHSHSVSGSAATTGSPGTNANLPPYITVYMWKRVA
jgi:hypothetical protein